jgi:hypothetical protein
MLKPRSDDPRVPVDKSSEETDCEFGPKMPIVAGGDKMNQNAVWRLSNEVDNE